MPVLGHLVHQADSARNLLHYRCRRLSKILLVTRLIVTRVRLVRVAVTAHLEDESYLVRLYHNFICLKLLIVAIGLQPI